MSTSIETATRGRLLLAAARVLADRGYAMASLDAIAQLAGLQAPAIYHYFASRDDLLGAVLEEGQRSVRRRVEAAIRSAGADADLEVRLAVAIEAHLRAAVEDCDFARAVIRNAAQMPEDLRPRLTEESEAFHDIWRALLDEAQETGRLRPGIDPRLGRMLAIGAMNWAVEWMGPSVDADVVVHHGRLMVLRGLLRPSAGTTPGVC